MSIYLKELGFAETPIGEISLRQRREVVTGQDVYEIKLGEEFLMSSLFTASEVALSKLGVEAVEGDHLDIIVGGLGLGYTAKAALDETRVGSLLIVEYLDAVISWHEEGLLPLGSELLSDPRTRVVQGDFFAMSRSDVGFDPDLPSRQFDAILVDIDHAPDDLLNDHSQSFYGKEGLTGLCRFLKPGGVFGLWSNAAPSADDPFVARLSEVFDTVRAEPVTFYNPLQDKPFTQTVYLGRRPTG